MIAFVCQALHQLPDQVGEQMDFFRFHALQKHWAKHPPVHMMIAAYLGVDKDAPGAPGAPAIVRPLPSAQSPSAILDDLLARGEVPYTPELVALPRVAPSNSQGAAAILDSLIAAVPRQES